MKKILIADDHWVVRQTLGEVVNSTPGMHVVGEAADGAECLSMVSRCAPDLLVLDINLPILSGIKVLEALNEQGIRIPILVFTMHPADQYAEHVRNLGASGFLSKEADESAIVQAIQQLLDGETVFPHSKLKRERRKALRSPLSILSSRESEVMRSLVHGEPNGVIAKRLGISPKSVSTYRSRIMGKLDLHSDAEMVALAVRLGAP